MKKIILLLIFIVITFAEIVCINNFKNDLNRKMKKDSKDKKLNVIENQLKEGTETINEMVLNPLNIVKKILFYEVFGLFPSYLIFIFLFFCFFIGKILFFFKLCSYKQESKNVIAI